MQEKNHLSAQIIHFSTAFCKLHKYSSNVIIDTSPNDA